MHQFFKRAFVAAVALSLTGCLWTPGKFTSELTLRKGGAFVLDYRGEMVLQLPPDEVAPWKPETAKCFDDLEKIGSSDATPKERKCTAAEIASQKSDYEQTMGKKRKESEDMAKMFGIPGSMTLPTAPLPRS